MQNLDEDINLAQVISKKKSAAKTTKKTTRICEPTRMIVEFKENCPQTTFHQIDETQNSTTPSIQVPKLSSDHIFFHSWFIQTVWDFLNPIDWFQVSRVCVMLLFLTL